MARYREERKMELVREWQASGLSKNMFCRAHGIACATVCTWSDKAASLPGNGVTSAPVRCSGFSRIEPDPVKPSEQPVHSLGAEAVRLGLRVGNGV